jgi:hypothetical protein
MIVVGNLTITKKAKVVELGFNTKTGTAVFTYRELATLISTLKKLEPEDEDDWKDLV